MSTRQPRIRTAYFGRSSERLSVLGLQRLLRDRDIEVVSVTCGRGDETSRGDGGLHRLARADNIALLDLQGVRETYDTLDLVISFSNPVIFPESFIASVRWGVVNLHPAPLPRYRGCHSIEHALIKGDEEFGATLHFCDGGIDTGPIIDEMSMRIEDHDTARTIWTRVDNLALRLLKRTVPRIVEAAKTGQRVPARLQDETVAHYFADESLPSELELDLGANLTTLLRQVRAYDHPRRKLAYVLRGDRIIRFRANDGEIVVASVEPRGRNSS